MFYSQKYGIAFILLSWLHYSAANLCFFHNEKKALDKIDRLIVQLHPDDYAQVKNALHIAYKGMQIGMESFFKHVEKAKLKQSSEPRTPLLKKFFKSLSNPISSVHGITYGSLYQCNSKACNKMRMYYLALNTDILFEELTFHDQDIFKEIFKYCIIKKDKNEKCINLFYYDLREFTRTEGYMY